MKRILYTALAVLLIGLGLFAYQRLWSTPGLKPTGPYSADTLAYHYTRSADVPRELTVQVSYPLYLDQASYPVIVFSPGLGVPVAQYKTIIEELVSHGYIVVGVDYPAATQEDVAREQAQLVADLQFVLDKLEDINTRGFLASKLDLDRIGLAGHSVGGGISVNACAVDARCKAVANIDGRFTYSPEFDEGFDKPSIFIRNPSHKPEKKEQLLQQLKRMTGSTEYHEIPNMKHNSFTDAGLTDGQAGLQKTRELLLKFFGEHL